MEERHRNQISRGKEGRQLPLVCQHYPAGLETLALWPALLLGTEESISKMTPGTVFSPGHRQGLAASTACFCQGPLSGQERSSQGNHLEGQCQI